MGIRTRTSGIMIPAYVAGTTPPTGPTWDPANKSASVTLSDSNLLATVDSGGATVWRTVVATTTKTTGKWYVEFKYQPVGAYTVSAFVVGITEALANYDSQITAEMCLVQGDDTGVAGGAEGVTQANIPVFSLVSGDVVGFSINFDNGRAWVSYNNTYVGDPAANSSPSFNSIPASTWYAVFGAFGTEGGGTIFAAMRLQATSATQTYTPPVGFSTWG